MKENNIKNKKERYRLYTFQFLIKQVGKGVNGVFKRLHKEDNEGKIIQTYTRREDIEK